MLRGGSGDTTIVTRRLCIPRSTPRSSTPVRSAPRRPLALPRWSCRRSSRTSGWTAPSKPAGLRGCRSASPARGRITRGSRGRQARA
jgi:hypothetical protein